MRFKKQLNNRQVIVYLPGYLKDDLKEYARERKISMSDVVRNLLQAQITDLKEEKSCEK